MSARDAGHIEAFAERHTNGYAVACVDRSSGDFMKLSFGALIMGALFVTALVAAAMLPASAHIGSVRVINQSDTCAWMTVYSSSGSADTWTILEGAFSRPRFVKPGERWDMGTTSGTNELKILAEVTKDAECHGGTIQTPYETYKKTDGDSYITRVDGYLRKVDGRYWVTIP
jgi:hypothetical protein